MNMEIIDLEAEVRHDDVINNQPLPPTQSPAIISASPGSVEHYEMRSLSRDRDALNDSQDSFYDTPSGKRMSARELVRNSLRHSQMDNEAFEEGGQAHDPHNGVGSPERPASVTASPPVSPPAVITDSPPLSLTRDSPQLSLKRDSPHPSLPRDSTTQSLSRNSPQLSLPRDSQDMSLPRGDSFHDPRGDSASLPRGSPQLSLSRDEAQLSLPRDTSHIPRDEVALLSRDSAQRSIPRGDSPVVMRDSKSGSRNASLNRGVGRDVSFAEGQYNESSVMQPVGIGMGTLMSGNKQDSSFENPGYSSEHVETSNGNGGASGGKRPQEDTENDVTSDEKQEGSYYAESEGSARGGDIELNGSKKKQRWGLFRRRQKSDADFDEREDHGIIFQEETDWLDCPFSWRILIPILIVAFLFGIIAFVLAVVAYVDPSRLPTKSVGEMPREGGRYTNTDDVTILIASPSEKVYVFAYSEFAFPYLYLDKSRLRGFVVELNSAICEEEGKRCAHVLAPQAKCWDETASTSEGLLSGRYDACGLVYHTQQKSLVADATPALFSAAGVRGQLWKKRLVNVLHLGNRKVGFLSGGIASLDCARKGLNLLEEQLVYANSPTELLDLLSAYKVSFVFLDDFTVRSLQQGGKYEDVEPWKSFDAQICSTGGLGLLTSKKSDVIEWYTKGLTSVRDGAMVPLCRRYDFKPEGC